MLSDEAKSKPTRYRDLEPWQQQLADALYGEESAPTLPFMHHRVSEVVDRIASDAARAAKRALVERMSKLADDIESEALANSCCRINAGGYANAIRAALRPEAATTERAVEPDAWVDRHGDVWRLGNDGLLWTEDTAPFPREHVEKKWGPLRPVADLAARPSSTRGGDDES